MYRIWIYNLSIWKCPLMWAQTSLYKVESKHELCGMPGHCHLDNITKNNRNKISVLWRYDYTISNVKSWQWDRGNCLQLRKASNKSQWDEILNGNKRFHSAESNMKWGHHGWIIKIYSMNEIIEEGKEKRIERIRRMTDVTCVFTNRKELKM